MKFGVTFRYKKLLGNLFVRENWLIDLPVVFISYILESNPRLFLQFQKAKKSDAD
jgi:hypothetical protein